MPFKEDFNLSPTQSSTLEEFRERMRDELDDEYKKFDEPYLFYRFLKARDWDLIKAETMLKKCLQWRKQNHFLKDYKPTKFLQKYFANFHFGYDKEGCPVFYAPTGKYDVNGLQMAARYSDIENTVYQLFALQEKYLEVESKKINRTLTGVVIILNSDGLTLSNAINKFDDWKDELLRVIDADQLPVFLGGTRTDPDGDPRCITFMNQGGKIDAIYYIHRSVRTLAESPGVERIPIPRASSALIPIRIRDPGSVIEWQFETKGGDIEFGLLFEDETGRVDEVIAKQRADTKDFFESGMYKCVEVGKYFLLFDNSHSWIRAKEVFFRIKILDPDELEERRTDQNSLLNMS